MKTLFMCAWLAAAAPLLAQVENAQLQGYSLPQFSFDALGYASGDSTTSRLDVYVEVPYENLSFVKSGTQFSAQYEATVDLLDESDVVVNEKSWTENVRVASYDETLAKGQYSLTQCKMNVKPGSYTILVQIRDAETRKAMRRKRSITIRSLTGDLAISDIMLVNRLSDDSGQKTIVPNISGNVANSTGGMYLFFEIYNRLAVDSFTVHTTIAGAKDEVVASYDDSYRAPRGMTLAFVKIPDPRLPTGEYILRVQLMPAGTAKSDRESATAGHAITVHWSGVPPSVMNLDLAIEELRYIASNVEMDSLLAAKTEQDKLGRFRAFWKRHDPTPGTERNELMDEYYARVAYSNGHFKGFLTGWKTDMGMVYIILGPPDDIDRHPFESDTRPYEVWQYNRFQRSFLFVDQSGFGDYRLSPLTPLSDIWQLNR